MVVVVSRRHYVDRPMPKSGLDGKFSVQYATAVALLDGEVTIDTFSDARRFAPDLEAILPRVRLDVRGDIPKSFDETWAVVHVHLTDGRTLSERCDKPRGLWGVPLTREERLTKFRNCVAPSLAEADADEIVRLVEGLSDLDNVRPLMNVVGRAQNSGGGQADRMIRSTGTQ